VADRRLLASGRDADVFDLGDGTVLRRYRDRDVPQHEADVMRYARGSGYPVPEIVSVSGPDMVLERVVGLTMQEALVADPTTLERIAGDLAELHQRLHRIAAPVWLPQQGDGDRLLHLDLHPGNVILGPGGAMVIDWANASRGEPALDPAIAIAIFVSIRASVGSVQREAVDRFTAAFAAHFDPDELHASLPLAISLRSRDRNVTDPERAELAALNDWPVR